ncbi:MAG: iron uptake porin [Scytonema sp. PMC 1069.18]|nr:iron uptake porin [Scytonema sp. PMC 1069.18]MEC4886445.1 iron uptake porin [Scytonema sp. PMC 1070.18]
MKKFFQTVTGAISCSYLLFSNNSVLAETTLITSETVAQNTLQAQQSPGLGDRVNSVSQLKDVQPTDWAFQALQSLVERYGVIAGYPNGTYRGNRAMTRYEFAAGLNAALDRINELVSASTENIVSRQDLAILQRLQEEFATELATLRGRVDALEAQTAVLEANQFSTTTKLTGQIILAANAGGFSGDRITRTVSVPPNPAQPQGGQAQEVIAINDPNATVLFRASLDFNTSFTGSDLLLVRMDTGSGIDRTNDRGITFARGIDDTAGFLEPSFGSVLDFSVEPPTSGSIEIGRLVYSFQPLENLRVSIGPDIRTTDYIDFNSYAYLSFRDFSTQAFTNNYILFPLSGPTAGAAINWKPGNGPLSVRALYAAAGAFDPGELGQNNAQNALKAGAQFVPLLYPLTPDRFGSDLGLFGDTYQSMVEVEYAPSRKFALRLQYSGGEILDNRYDVFGANFELALSSKFAIFGRYGYGSYDNTAFGDINPNYWMAGIAFPDLFTRGALAGFAAGQPFIASEIGNSTQTNYEAFYNFPISRNIQVTPLVQVITNASNQEDNDTIITGTLRTVFSF